MNCACPSRNFYSRSTRCGGFTPDNLDLPHVYGPRRPVGTRKTSHLRVALGVMARIDAFLKLAVAQGCSDLHLAVGVPPMMRMHGDLIPIKFRELGETELESYITEVLTQNQLKVL